MIIIILEKYILKFLIIMVMIIIFIIKYLFNYIFKIKYIGNLKSIIFINLNILSAINFAKILLI